MTVILTTDIPLKTQVGYETLLSAIEGELKKAEGLIVHSSHRVSRGWRIIEIWQSREAADRFFTAHVAPNIPPNRRPFRTFQDLHNHVLPKKEKRTAAKEKAV